MIVVISTGWKAPTKMQCIASVQSQLGIDYRHIYVEASEQQEPKTMIENVRDAIMELDKHDVVVSLDGDDWLAHNNVLSYVQRMYDQDRNLWLTYGSYKFSDGRQGHAGSHTNENYRQSPFVATHLKTFKAGLFQRIVPDDLKYKGEWRHRGQDVAMMFPMMEMAGPARIKYVQDILYVYNYASSFEFNAKNDELLLERAMVNDVRSRKPYGRVQSL